MPMILHCADLHIDSPLLRLKGEQAALRREELMERFAAMLRFGAQKGAQVVLIAGDVFDRRCVRPQSVRALLELMAAQPQMRFFIAPGNHDCADVQSLWHLLDLPPNVSVFLSERIDCVPLPALGCCVYGAAFVREEMEVSNLQGFCARPPEGLTPLMVLHGDLAKQSNYNPIPTDMIADSGLSYLALGHVHRFSGIARAGGCHYAYSGVLEPRGFDETGEKGFIWGNVSQEACDLHFEPFAKRRYELLSLDISDLTHFEAIAAAAEALVAPLGEANLYRITLKGSRPADLSLNTAALEERLLPFCFFVQVQDESRAETDYAALAKERTPLGLFVKQGLKALEEAPEGERELQLGALEAGVWALSGEGLL